MKFYTDGSRIGLQAGQSFIGWSAVCNRGVIVAEGRFGGSNINAEIFAIRDLVKYLANKQLKVLDADNGKAEILTDSKVSIQIINGYLRAPEEYDIEESENYEAASVISGLRAL